MAGNIARANKLHAQLQTAPADHACETKLIELEQIKNWNFAKRFKRERFEILAEVLLYCNQQKGKTEIMYKTNLNCTQLKKHLRSLTSKGLLDANTDKYVTTQKGQRFLKIFAQLDAMPKSP